MSSSSAPRRSSTLPLIAFGLPNGLFGESSIKGFFVVFEMNGGLVSIVVVGVVVVEVVVVEAVVGSYGGLAVVGFVVGLAVVVGLSGLHPWDAMIKQLKAMNSFIFEM